MCKCTGEKNVGTQYDLLHILTFIQYESKKKKKSSVFLLDAVTRFHLFTGLWTVSSSTLERHCPFFCVSAATAFHGSLHVLSGLGCRERRNRCWVRWCYRYYRVLFVRHLSFIDTMRGSGRGQRFHRRTRRGRGDVTFFPMLPLASSYSWFPRFIKRCWEQEEASEQ